MNTNFYKTQILLAVLLLAVVTPAFIVPDKHLPFFIQTPNPRIGETNFKLSFRFKLLGTDLTDGNVFALDFSNSSAETLNPIDCNLDLSKLELKSSVQATLNPASSTNSKGAAYCEVTNNDPIIISTHSYLELIITFPGSMLNYSYIKQVSLRLLTSTENGAVVIAESPFFSSYARYSEVESNLDLYATLDSFNWISTSKCPNSDTCPIVYPETTFDLNLRFNTKKQIDTYGEIIVLLEFTNINGNNVTGTSTQPNFSVSQYKSNAIKLNFTQNLPSDKLIIVKLTGFITPSLIGEAKFNLSFYWKNTFSRISQVVLPSVMIEPFPISFTSDDNIMPDWKGIAHPEFFDIYENGAWPIKFIMDLPPLREGGYVKIENISNLDSIFNFIPSTCDFSEDTTGNLLLGTDLGKRAQCYSTYNTLGDSNVTKSSIFFKVAPSAKPQTISVIVWGVAVRCSTNDIFSLPPFIRNILKSDNQTRFKFNYEAYRKVSQTSETPFDITQLYAKSVDIMMYGRCFGSLITHPSTFPSTDTNPWNLDTNYVTDDSTGNSNIPKDVLLYSEIHDWNLTQKSNSSNQINFINETNYLYLNSISVTGIYDIEFGGLSNNFNNFPQPATQGTLSLQLSRKFLANGDSSCELRWYNNGQTETSGASSNVIYNATNLSSDKVMNLSTSNLNANLVASPKMYASPIVIESNKLSELRDGSTRFFRGSTIDENLGFHTNCYKLVNPGNVKSVYTYIDFTYVHKRNGTPNRVGRFIKLFPSQQVFNDKSSFVKTNLSHEFYHAFSSDKENVCILRLDGTLFDNDTPIKINSMNIHLLNLRLLDLDYNQISTDYPTFNLVANSKFTSLLYPFSHSNYQGDLNTPLKDCTVFSSTNPTQDDPLFCRCSSINPHPSCALRCNLNPYHPRCFCSSPNPDDSCTVDCSVNVFHSYCKCNTMQAHSTCPLDCSNKYFNFGICNCLSINPNPACPVNCEMNSNHPSCKCQSNSPHITCPVMCSTNDNHPKCNCNSQNYHYTCKNLDCFVNFNYWKCGCAGLYPNVNCPINCNVNSNHPSCKCNIKSVGAPHPTCPIDCTNNQYHPSCYCLPSQSSSVNLPNATCPIDCQFNSLHPDCQCNSANPHISCQLNCSINIKHPNCNCNSTTARPHISCPVANCNVIESIRHPLCYCKSQNTDSHLPNLTCQIMCTNNPVHPSCNCFSTQSGTIINSSCPINCRLYPNHPTCNCSGTSPHYTCPINCSVNNNHPGCECSVSPNNFFISSSCVLNCTINAVDTRCKCSTNNPNVTCPINCLVNNFHPSCNCASTNPHPSCWIDCSTNANHPNCHCEDKSMIPHITCPINCANNNKHPRCFCTYYPDLNCNIDCQLNARHPSCFCNEVFGFPPHPTCTPKCYIIDNHPDCNCDRSDSSKPIHSSCKIDCANQSNHPSCNCSSQNPHYSCTMNCVINPYHPYCYCFSTAQIPNSNCPIDCANNDLHPSCNCRGSSPHLTCPKDCTNKNINHPGCNCTSFNPDITCPIQCALNNSHPSCNCNSNTPHITCSINCLNNSYHPLCNCNDEHLIPHSSCPVNCLVYQNYHDCRCESQDLLNKPHQSCPINCSYNDNHPLCSCGNNNYLLRHDTCPYDCSDNSNPKCNCTSSNPDISCTLNCRNNINHPLCYCSSLNKVPDVFCVPNCSLNDKHPHCYCNSTSNLNPPNSTCPIDCTKNNLHPSCKCETNLAHSTCPLNCNTNPNNSLCACQGNTNCTINCQNFPNHPFCFCSVTGILQSQFCTIRCDQFPFHPSCNCESTNSLNKPHISCIINCTINSNHPSCNCNSANLFVGVHATCPITCNINPNHPSCNCSSNSPHITCPVNCQLNNKHQLCYCNTLDGSYPVSQYCDIDCNLNNRHPNCNCNSTSPEIIPHFSCPSIDCKFNQYHPYCICSSTTPHVTCSVDCTKNSYHPMCKCHSDHPDITCIKECFYYPNHPLCNCSNTINVDDTCQINCVANGYHPYCRCSSTRPHSSCPIDCSTNSFHPLCFCSNIVGITPHISCPINCLINQYHPSCKCTSVTPDKTCMLNCSFNNYHPLCYCYSSIGTPNESCPINCSINSSHSGCNCNSASPHWTCPKVCTLNGNHPDCNCDFSNKNYPIDVTCPVNCSVTPQHPLCNCDSVNPHFSCPLDCSKNYFHPNCNCFIQILTPNSNCPVNCSFNSLHPSCNCTGTNPNASCPILCNINTNHPYCNCNSINALNPPHTTCTINCSSNINHPYCNCSSVNPHITCPMNNCLNSYHPSCNCFQNINSINSNCPMYCDLYDNHPNCLCNSASIGFIPNIDCAIDCTNKTNLHPLCKCSSTNPHPTCPVNCGSNANHYLCDCQGTNPDRSCDNNTCTTNYYHPSCNCKTGNPNPICPVRCDYNINHPSCNCESGSPHETCPINCSSNSAHPFCHCDTISSHITCPKDCAGNAYHPDCLCNTSTPDITCPINCSTNPNHPNCNCDGIKIMAVHSSCAINCLLTVNHPNCHCDGFLGSTPHISCPIACDSVSTHPLCACNRDPFDRRLLRVSDLLPHPTCPIQCANLSFSHPLCKCYTDQAHATCSLDCGNYPYQPYCNCFSVLGVPNSNCPVNCSLKINHPQCKCNDPSNAHASCPRNCLTLPNSSLCGCSTSNPHFTCTINCATNSSHPACSCSTSNAHPTCSILCNLNPYQDRCYCYSLTSTPNIQCPINCSRNNNHASCQCLSSTPHSTCPVYCNYNDFHELCNCTTIDDTTLAPHKTCTPQCNKYPLHPLCRCSVKQVGVPHSTCSLDCGVNPYHPSCNCFINDPVPNSKCPKSCGIYPRHPGCHCYDTLGATDIECPIDCSVNSTHPNCHCNALITDAFQPHSTCTPQCNLYPKHPSCNCTGLTPHITCSLDCNSNYNHLNCYCNNSLIGTPIPHEACPINCFSNNRHPLCKCDSMIITIKPHYTCIINCTANPNHPRCNCDSSLNFEVHPTCPINCTNNSNHFMCKCSSTTPHQTCPVNCQANYYHSSCLCFGAFDIPNVNCPIDCRFNNKHPNCNCNSSQNIPHFSCPINCGSNINHPLCRCTSTTGDRPNSTCPINCKINSYHPYCGCNGQYPNISCSVNCSINYFHSDCNCFNAYSTPNQNCPLMCNNYPSHPLCKCNSQNIGDPHISCPKDCINNPFHPLCGCSWLTKPDRTCIVNCYVNPFNENCDCDGFSPHLTCPVNCYLNPYHPSCKCNSIDLLNDHTCPIKADCDVNPFGEGCSCKVLDYTKRTTCAREEKVHSVLRNLHNSREKAMHTIYSFFGSTIEISNIQNSTTSLSIDLHHSDLILPVICPTQGSSRAYINPEVTIYSFSQDSTGLISSVSSNIKGQVPSSNIIQAGSFPLTKNSDLSKIVKPSYSLYFSDFSKTDQDLVNTLYLSGDIDRICDYSVTLLSDQITTNTNVSLNGSNSVLYSNKPFFVNKIKYSTLLLNSFSNALNLFSKAEALLGVNRPDANKLLAANNSFGCINSSGIYTSINDQSTIEDINTLGWSINISKGVNTPVTYISDKSHTIDITITIPSSLPSTSLLKLDSNLANDNTLCAIDNNTSSFSDACNTSSSTLTCPISIQSINANSNKVKVCCHNVLLDKENIIVQKSSRIYSANINFSNYFSIDGLAILDSSYANRSARSSLVPSITSYKFSQVTQLNGLGEVALIINLIKPAFPNQRIRIAGNFNPFFISGDVPECKFSYNSDSSSTFKLNSNSNEDLLVDRCIISRDSTAISVIDLYNKNRIYKCGMKFNSVAVIKLSPVYVGSLYNQSSSYSVVSSIATFDPTNIISADAKAIAFPDFSFNASNIVSTYIEKLCDVDSSFPSLIGFRNNLSFSFDLSSISKQPDYPINEFSIFLRSKLYNRDADLVCIFDGLQTTPCEINDQSGFLNIKIPKGISIGKVNKIIVRNLIPKDNLAQIFDCSVNTYDVVTDIRQNILVGRGSNSFNILGLGATFGLLLNNNVPISDAGKSLLPKTTTSLNFDFVMDTTQKYELGAQAFTPSTNSYPGLLIELPTDYATNYESTLNVEAKVTIVSDKDEDVDKSLKVLSVTVNGNAILVTLNETNITLDVNYTTFSVSLTNILTPFNDVQTGVLKIALLNDVTAPTKIFTNNNNLNAFSPSLANEQYSQFTRGYNYAYPEVNSSALTQAIRINTTNYIEISQGIYSQVTAEFNSFIFPVDYDVSFELEDGSLFKILNSKVTLNNSTKRSVSFYFGTSCGILPGIYIVRFKPHGAANILPIGPILVKVLQMTVKQSNIILSYSNSEVNSQSSFQMSAGGKFKVFIISQAIPLDNINFSYAFPNTNSNQTTILNSKIDPIAGGTTISSFNIIIADATIKTVQTLNLSVDNKCFKFDGIANKNVSFDPSVPLTDVKKITLDSLFTYNLNSELNSFSFNIKPVANSILYCSLMCASVVGPSSLQMINRVTLNSTPTNYDFIYQFTTQSSSVNQNISNLLRGQDYKLKCVLTSLAYVNPDSTETVMTKMIGSNGTYYNLSTTPSNESISIGITTTQPLSQQVTQAIVRSFQSKYITEDLYVTDSNGFTINQALRNSAPVCLDEGKLPTLRFMQDSPILISSQTYVPQTSNPNNYFLIIEEGYTSQSSVKSKYDEVSSIVSNQDQLNSSISRYTTEVIQEKPILNTFDDLYIDSSLLITPSNNALSFNAPYTVLSIQYPTLQPNLSIKCYWKVGQENDILLYPQTIIQCNMSDINSSDLCNSFIISSKDAKSANLQTGNLPPGTYSFHIFCQNTQPYSKYYIHRNVGKLQFSTAIIPIEAESSQTTSPLGSFNSKLNLILVLLVIHLLLA